MPGPPIQTNQPGLATTLGRVLGIQGDMPALVQRDMQASVNLVDLTDHQYLRNALTGTYHSGDNGAFGGVAGTNWGAILLSQLGIGPLERLVRIRRIYLSRTSAVPATVQVAWAVGGIFTAVPAIASATSPNIGSRDGRDAPQPAMIYQVGTILTIPSGPRITLPVTGAGQLVIDLNLTIPSGGFFMMRALTTDQGIATGIEWDERLPTEQEMLNAS